jgi:hypothetical protein
MTKTTNKSDIFKKEISFIKNDKYKENARILLELLPDYFFEVAASSTGKYHPSFSLGDGGLVRHTKAAVYFAKEMLENSIFGDAFKQEEKDLMILGLILHDGLKHGKVKSKYVTFDHPIAICDFIRENADKLTLKEGEIKFLTHAMESHMGPWTTNSYSDVVLPAPTDKYQKFLHMCDYLSSRKVLDIKFEGNDIIE